MADVGIRTQSSWCHGVACLAVVMILAIAVPVRADIIGRASVIDGDTIEIHVLDVRMLVQNSRVMRLNRLGATIVMVSGFGMAALGRPGYINLGHGADLGAARDVPAMESRSLPQSRFCSSRNAPTKQRSNDLVGMPPTPRS